MNQVEEQMEQTLQGRREVSEELKRLKSLREDPGFVELCKAMEINLKNLRDEFELREANGLDTLIANESLRGEIKATRLWLEFTDLRINELETALKIFDEQLEAEMAYAEELKDG